MAMIPKPVVLIVIDGLGLAPESRSNPVSVAAKPVFDSLDKQYLFKSLQASGVAVGLPWGEAGNSEVGHLTIGAGRALYHHLPRIIFSINDGSFFKSESLLKAAGHVKQNNSNLHIFGLISSGSVHSYIDHLYALLEFVTRENMQNVFIHAITDGKDAPPQEGADFIPALEKRIRRDCPSVKIASLIGRYYAMDRDEKWDRIKMAYDLLTNGNGVSFGDISTYLSESYKKGQTDQFIEPAYAADESGNPIGRINDNDAVIVFNFREDSMREICEALIKPGFDLFPRKNINNFLMVTMTEYEKGFPAIAVFPPLEINWPLSRVIADAGKTQMHIAETEKYAHVTYFFNGGQEKPVIGEDRILVQSASVPHFDDKPEMMAEEIKERVLENIQKYDFMLVNFANADMVGHTGNFDATIKAVETTDKAVGEIIEAVDSAGGLCIITADHGNAEEKINPISGEPSTEHTLNAVPFYIVGKDFKLKTPRTNDEIKKMKRETTGILADIAPTILEIMQLRKPDEMTGNSLLGEKYIYE